MGYLILVLILVVIIISIFKGISKFFYSLLTLSFLPNAIGMFDGNVSSYVIPIIGPTLGVILNYLIAAFINLIDFFLWFIHWIPGLNQIINVIYSSPDIVERVLPFMFGGLGGHRNFITHSVLNPVFLIFLMVSFILIKLLSNFKLGEIVRILCFLLGLTFICHLLADTMPKSWVGFANIKIYLFTNIFTLPPFLSKFWLYLNTFLCFKALFSVTIKDES